MDHPVEPYQDHRTIGSFKRTFNATVLLRASRVRTIERPLSRGSLIIAGVAGWTMNEIAQAILSSLPG